MNGTGTAPQNSATAGFGEFISVGIFAVLKLFTIALVGAVLRIVNTLDKQGTKCFGKVNIDAAIPCLVWVNLMQAELTVRKLIEAIVLPLCVFLNLLFGIAAGRSIRFLLKKFGAPLPSGFQRSFDLACGFGNGSSLPIVFLDTIASMQPGFGNPAAVVAYVGLYMPAQHLMLWGFAYPYLNQNSEPATPIEADNPKKPLLKDEPAALPIAYNTFSTGKPATHMDPGENAPSLDTIPSCPDVPPKTFYTRLSRVSRLARRTLNPPLIAVILGLTMSLIAPVRQLFFHHLPIATPPLDFVFRAIQTVASAAIPLSILALGANLAAGPNRDTPMRGVVAVLLVKFILVPMFSLVVFELFEFFGIMPHNRRIRLVVLIVPIMPTANNVLNICIARGLETKYLATSMFWQLCFMLPAVMIWLVVALPMVYRSPPIVNPLLPPPPVC